MERTYRAGAYAVGRQTWRWPEFSYAPVFGTLILCACLLAPLPAAALKITKASIEEGKLVVEGTTRKPRELITLDRRFDTRSDADNRFRFSVTYLPADCIVDIRRRTIGRRAVVANCGPRGKAGPRGPRGAVGRKGERGEQGPAGEPGAGAGRWWHRELLASADAPAEILTDSGHRLPIPFVGSVFCAAKIDGSAVLPVAAAYFVQLDGTGVRWVIHRTTPDSQDDRLPVVFTEDDVLKVRNNSGGEPALYRCRIERLYP